MSAAAVAHVYRYLHSSALVKSAGAPQLRMATSGGQAENPYFFRGKLLHPFQIGILLRGLMEVVQSRYYVPPSVIARNIRLADPVVTSNDDRLRFEGFSACCSAYARVDLLPGATDGETIGRGTTNVDFNPSMLATLARLRDGEEVQLAVGADEVRLERGSEAIVERKVKLPIRWLKGFAEVHAYLPRMTLMHEVSALAAQRFLRSLPTIKARTTSWVVRDGAGLRLTQRETALAVPVAGIDRLRALEHLARHARGLQVFADLDSESSGWTLLLDEARFHLVLSPEPARGFSGEGQSLNDLAGGLWQNALPGVRASLCWQSVIDEARLIDRVGQPRECIRAALAALGARGLVGYDLGTAAYFHREMPFDLEQVEELHPRLIDARALVAEKKVRLVRREGTEAELYVQGTNVEHRIRLQGEKSICSCPWFAQHGGQRGPCKHVLAARLMLEGEA
jgi:hypothetical protein